MELSEVRDFLNKHLERGDYKKIAKDASVSAPIVTSALKADCYDNLTPAMRHALDVAIQIAYANKLQKDAMQESAKRMCMR